MTTFKKLCLKGEIGVWIIQKEAKTRNKKRTF